MPAAYLSAFRSHALTRIGFLTALTGLLAACSGGPQTPDDEPLAGGFDRPTAVVLSLPSAQGPGSYFDATTLEPIEGLTTPSLPALSAVWGVHQASGTLIGVTQTRHAVAIDLESGRTTDFARNVTGGALSPSGTAHAVTDAGDVVQLRRREQLSWPVKLDTADALFPGPGDRLLSVSRGAARVLTVISADGQRAVHPLPQGAVAVTTTGDLLAVGTDSGIGFFDPTGSREPWWVRIRGRQPLAIAFSPSGHRLYFTHASTGVGVVDRFAREEIDGLPSPGGAVRLRSDPLGRWLILQRPGGDSVAIVDAADGRYLGALVTEWDISFPVITPDGVLVVSQGADLAAIDPATLTERARRERGDGHWVPTTYLPRRLPTVALANQPAGADTAVGAIYVQVASSQNPTWAAGLATSLVRDARLPARVLSPETPGEGYRVVLGPYSTREEATAIGARLGRPFWIFTRERGAAPQ